MKIDPTSLSMSAQAKLAAALRQQQKALAKEFDRLVEAEVKRRLDEGGVLDRYRQDIADARAVTEARKGIMPLAEFNLIRRVLHPDNSASPELRAQAFIAFEKRKLVLIKEEEHPTKPQPSPLPTTAAEWEKARADVMAKRKRKREEARAAQPAKR